LARKKNVVALYVQRSLHWSLLRFWTIGDIGTLPCITPGRAQRRWPGCYYSTKAH
jgi:hypothetical protein